MSAINATINHYAETRRDLSKELTHQPKSGKKNVASNKRAKPHSLGQYKSRQSFGKYPSTKRNKLNWPETQLKKKKSHLSFCKESNKGFEKNVEQMIKKFLTFDEQQSSSGCANLCAFCGLSANFIPGVGDLYGPYRPTFTDVVDRYDAACAKLNEISGKLKSHTNSAEMPSPKIQFNNNKCYVTINRKPICPISTTDVASVKSLTKSVSCESDHLKLLQIVDSVLLESDKKHRSSNSFRKFHIPGLDGEVKFTSQVKPGQKCVPKIDSIVFNEPAVEIHHSTRNSDFPSNHLAEKLKSDCTSVHVCHSFDTSQIWVHAECAVWTPNLHCVGGQLFGLFDSVREALTKHCVVCKRVGASLSCYGCKNRFYHYPCAITMNLTLNPDTFMVQL